MSPYDPDEDDFPRFSEAGISWTTPAFIRLLMESDPASAVFVKFQEWLEESPSEQHVPVPYSWGMPDFGAAMDEFGASRHAFGQCLGLTEIEVDIYELGFHVPSQHELMRYARALDWPMVRFFENGHGVAHRRTAVARVMRWPKTSW